MRLRLKGPEPTSHTTSPIARVSRLSLGTKNFNSSDMAGIARGGDSIFAPKELISRIKALGAGLPLIAVA